MQVNYLSNVLLLAALLLGLEAGIGNTGRASLISWVGSRRHESPTWASKKHVKKDESILNHMDDPKNFGFTTECGDTRILCHCSCTSWHRNPTLRKSSSIWCALQRSLWLWGPMRPIRIYIGIVQAIKDRSVKEGAWVLSYAALVVDSSSNGRFITDKDMTPQPANYSHNWNSGALTVILTQFNIWPHPQVKNSQRNFRMRLWRILRSTRLRRRFSSTRFE